jgi:class 3 adenylate cyclase
MEEQTNDLEKILAERVKLDDMLKSKFSKKTTIMFTDIKGSTAFYEQRGDLDGRMMVHRHNEIVLPLIAANRGKLIKTIGDATMSQYEDPQTVSVPRSRSNPAKGNNDVKTAGSGSVRIGLNTGIALRKGRVRRRGKRCGPR